MGLTSELRDGNQGNEEVGTGSKIVDLILARLRRDGPVLGPYHTVSEDPSPNFIQHRRYPVNQSNLNQETQRWKTQCQVKPDLKLLRPLTSKEMVPKKELEGLTANVTVRTFNRDCRIDVANQWNIGEDDQKSIFKDQERWRALSELAKNMIKKKG